MTTAEHSRGSRDSQKKFKLYFSGVRIDHYRNIALEIKLFIELSFDNNNFTMSIILYVCSPP